MNAHRFCLVIAASTIVVVAVAYRPLKSLFENDSYASKQAFFQDNLHRHYVRRSKTTPSGAVVLLGASTIQGVNSANLNFKVVNLGIGGQTSSQLSERIADYGALSHTCAVVMQVGYNDALQGEAAGFSKRLAGILESLSAVSNIILLATQIARVGADTQPEYDTLVNQNIVSASICGSAPNCEFLQWYPANGLPTDEFEDDRIHLNQSGYRRLAGQLNAALRSKQC